MSKIKNAEQFAKIGKDHRKQVDYTTDHWMVLHDDTDDYFIYHRNNHDPEKIPMNTDTMEQIIKEHNMFPELLEALNGIRKTLDGSQPKDIKGAVMAIDHLISKIEGK